MALGVNLAAFIYKWHVEKVEISNLNEFTARYNDKAEMEEVIVDIKGMEISEILQGLEGYNKLLIEVLEKEKGFEDVNDDEIEYEDEDEMINRE